MAAYLSKADRQPAANAAEAAALTASMIAYTGKFRLESDRFVTTVDGAWNEIYKATEQVRYFNLNGGRQCCAQLDQAVRDLGAARRVRDGELWRAYSAVGPV